MSLKLSKARRVEHFPQVAFLSLSLFSFPPIITLMALTAKFTAIDNPGLSGSKTAVASSVNSWSHSVCLVYDIFRSCNCRRLTMMKMRYDGPPTLSVIILIGQHNNSYCWLEK